MIQPQELRIGNNVLPIMGGVAKVYKISNNLVTLKVGINVFKAKYEDITGIPLTEEWLFKFGFEKRAVQYYVYHAKDSNFTGIVFWMPQYNKFGYELGKGKYRVLDSVHHLQNVIHALGYQELIVTN